MSQLFGSTSEQREAQSAIGLAALPGRNVVGGSDTLFSASVTAEQNSRNVFGSAAIAGDMAVTPLDATLTALDLSSGKPLWTYPLSSAAYASPAVVPSGVYARTTLVTCTRLVCRVGVLRRRGDVYDGVVCLPSKP